MGYFIRRFLFCLLIVVVLAIVFLPLWTSQMAEKAFQNPEEPWAPGAARKAIKIKMAIYMYDDAFAFAEKAIETFPKSKHLPYFIYSAALSAEKEENPSRALDLYSLFIKKFPNHMWSDQARGHKRKLNALLQAN